MSDFTDKIKNNKINISLIGNPNCGKTTIFNLLTNDKSKTGNWSGVTVNKNNKSINYHDKIYNFIDLPGIYSLEKNSFNSKDQQIAINHLLSNSKNTSNIKNDIVINIIDSSNLEKSLFLTSQLLEINKKLLLILNMEDIARKNHILIDIKRLSKRLNIEIITLNAKDKKNKENNINEIFAKINKLAKADYCDSNYINFPPNIENIINLIISKFSLNRFNAIDFFLKEKFLQDKYKNLLSKEEYDLLVNNFSKKIDFQIINLRQEFINNIIKSINRDPDLISVTISDKIDNIITNKFLSIPIFLFTIYALFFIAINVGGSFIDFFHIIFSLIFIDIFAYILSLLYIPDFIIYILTKGIGSAIVTLASFIPIIFFLYLFLSLIETTGYISRLAFISQRFMNFLGLPGKSFISLSMGFGCSVPAIMSTRTIDNFYQKIITILMIPFISCGAKLPVYILFIAVFFEDNGQNIIFLLYLIGIILALITGFLSNKLIFKSKDSFMIFDLPNYHLPDFKEMITISISKVKFFIIGAGKLIIILIFILNMLNSIGVNYNKNLELSFKENNEYSILSHIGKFITPLFYPMGIEKDNWQATVGIFTGMLAKEALVGTLDNLYQENNEQSVNYQNLSLNSVIEGSKISILQAFSSVLTNLSDSKDNIYDPMNIYVKDEIIEVKEDMQDFQLNMSSKFNGKIGAFAYLLFILSYAPCASALSVANREIGSKWTIITAIWSTLFAYIIAVLFYQIANLLIN